MSLNNLRITRSKLNITNHCIKVTVLDIKWCEMD